jgi:hypothetical protein
MVMPGNNAYSWKYVDVVAIVIGSTENKWAQT